MIEELAGLTDVHQVAVLALRLRALDAGSPRPILADRASVTIAESLGLDLDTPHLPWAVAAVAALRAGLLDDVVGRFVSVHPDAVVVDLGCGFDPRARRCGTPASVDWFSIDLPPIAELRRRFVPGPEHIIAADVTTTGWLGSIPADRPAIVVSDGLVPLLSDQELRAVCRAATGHFRAGEIAFLAYSRLAMRNSRRVRVPALYVPTRADGIDDPHEPEAWDARLVLREELFKSHAPQIGRFPAPFRVITGLCERSPRIARAGGRVLRYAFN